MGVDRPASDLVQGSVPYGGRVTAVVPHPTSVNTIYIGSDSGGIWRTTDAGVTWRSLTDDLPVPAIQSMAIDPASPSLLYATTINRTYPTRLLRSADAGDSWTVSSIVTDTGQALSPAPCSVNVFKACIPPSSGRILIDPRRAGSPNTSTVYYAGASHLFRSDDSGQTFHAVLSLAVDLDFSGASAPTDNPEVEFIRDAAVDPSRPDLLYVAVAKPRCADSSCGTMTSAIVLYRSFDAGGHWVRQELSSLGAYLPGEYPLCRSRCRVRAARPAGRRAVEHRHGGSGVPRRTARPPARAHHHHGR